MYKRFSSVVIPLVISNTINVKKDVISPDSFRKLQISIRLNYLVAKKNPEILYLLHYPKKKMPPNSESQRQLPGKNPTSTE